MVAWLFSSGSSLWCSAAPNLAGSGMDIEAILESTSEPLPISLTLHEELVFDAKGDVSAVDLGCSARALTKMPVIGADDLVSHRSVRSTSSLLTIFEDREFPLRRLDCEPVGEQCEI